MKNFKIKSASYKGKSGKKVFVRGIVRQDSTPYIQDPETGFIIGRDKKT